MTGLTLDDFAALAGSELGVSRWFEVGQDRIDAFADATEDHQFIHVDPAQAALTPFGGTIAHGFLSLALLSAMAYDAIPAVDGVRIMVNYGLDRVRFLSPVRAGASVRGRFVLAGVEPRGPGQQLARYAVTVEIDGETKPALTADWLGLIIT
jgi:acyl dehydratase